jgi:hypothetical protein
MSYPELAFAVLVTAQVAAIIAARSMSGYRGCEGHAPHPVIDPNPQSGRAGNRAHRERAAA